jgi:hypothetical protein
VKRLQSPPRAACGRDLDVASVGGDGKPGDPGVLEPDQPRGGGSAGVDVADEGVRFRPLTEENVFSSDLNAEVASSIDLPVSEEETAVRAPDGTSERKACPVSYV